MVSVLDWLRPPADQSHLGKFVQTVIDGGAWDVIEAQAGARTWTSCSATCCRCWCPCGVLFVVLVLLRPSSWGANALQRAFDRSPVLRAGSAGGLRHVGDRLLAQRLRHGDPRGQRDPGHPAGHRGEHHRVGAAPATRQHHDHQSRSQPRYGYALLRRSVTPLPWGRLFALEVAAFLTLGLACRDEWQFSRPGGSRRRWWADWVGNGHIVLAVWDKQSGRLVMFIPWLLALMSGFNVWALIERSLTKLAGENPPVETVIQPEVQEEAPVVEEKKEKQPRKKTEPLPPEFRKSLRVSEHQDKKPAAPRERDERLPSLNILLADQNTRPDERTINQTAGMIEKTLAEFGIVATVIGFRVGPTITQFAVQPGFMKRGGDTTEEEAQQIKVRVAQIASLQKDLALALSAERLRIEAPVPGKPYVGIEVPNSHTCWLVRMRSILETDAFHKIGTPLAMALGRDVSGQPVVADLARMPHLLIAGATGSGKSVCITAIAACLAMNNPPEDLRMVMIDSKMVELLRFNGLPHLYGKVETNIERIMGVLRWVVVEMEHRYRLLEAAHARDLENYNRRLARKKDGAPLAAYCSLDR